MAWKYALGAIIAVILAGIAFFGLSQPTGLASLETGNEKIVIGAIQPLTGSIANIGQNARAAMEIAVEEINAKGGINGKELVVKFEDGQCEAKAAATAAKKLVEVDGVKVIIGGTCSAETMAAAPITEAGKVVQLSNCSSNPAITNAGDYIFRAYPSDSFQGEIAAKFAFDDLKARKATILSCVSEWCAGIKEVFKEKFTGLGGSIVAEEEFQMDSKDLKTQLLKIRETGPDLVYFLGYTKESAAGIKQARELGMEAKILGADAWVDPALWSSTTGSNEGVMYTTVKTPENQAFVEALEEKVGKGNGMLYCSSQSYDAVYLIAEALKKCGENSECIKEELYKVKGLNGLSGEISFDRNGDLETAEYAIHIVRNGEAVDYQG